METYTIEQFAEKHGLTLNQVKFNAVRGRMDSEIGKFVPRRRGGNKSIRLIQETERTLEQVAKIKALDLANTRKSKGETMLCKNGVEVLNNILGKVMYGSDDARRHDD